MPRGKGDFESIPCLVAIGGGGGTHGTDPGLDSFCLKLSGPAPSVGFVGLADRDPRKLERLRAALGTRVARVSALPEEAGEREARSWSEQLDMVYVGGGDPVALVKRLRSRRLSGALTDAARRGAVMVGVSAGAMCWFESYIWRAPSGALEMGEGLGAVAGAMTPHSLTEPGRVGALRDLVATGAATRGFAVDDGAAIVLRHGEPDGTFPDAGPPTVHAFPGDVAGERSARESAAGAPEGGPGRSSGN